jgi:regulator of sigma E protease
MAKWGGIRVDEFGLGLPPRVFGVKYGETTYTLNWLPFGGFVKIFGEDPNDENINGPDKERSFVHRPKWIQALVLVAGVTLNAVFAWILISINLMIGMPVATEGIPASMSLRNEKLAIVNVLKDSPAELGGLKSGDELVSLSVGEEKVTDLSSEAVSEFIQKFPDQEVQVEYSRVDEEGSAVALVTPKAEDAESNAMIGIAMQKIGLVSVSWWQAPAYGLYFTYHLAVNTLLSFKDFFGTIFTDGRGALTAVAGPIGIYSLMNDATHMGLVYLLNFVAIISLNLAILNLLPFPALDGGRLLFVAIEAIIRKPIKPVVANTLNMIGFVLLILLMLVIAGSDIVKLL